MWEAFFYGRVFWGYPTHPRPERDILHDKEQLFVLLEEDTSVNDRMMGYPLGGGGGDEVGSNIHCIWDHGVLTRYRSDQGRRNYSVGSG